jgi:hypothetical protein
MPEPKLSLDDAYDMLLSWSQTLVDKVTAHKQRHSTNLGEIKEVMEEVVGCVKLLEDAARRSRT